MQALGRSPTVASVNTTPRYTRENRLGNVQGKEKNLIPQENLKIFRDTMEEMLLKTSTTELVVFEI